MPKVARLGDPSSHGGSIVSASTKHKANGIGIARQGDMHSCPLHGQTPLTSIISHTKSEDKLVITVGATAGCGAVITSGSPNVSAI